MNNLHDTQGETNYLPKITGRIMRQIREAMLTKNEHPNAFIQRPKVKLNK